VRPYYEWNLKKDKFVKHPKPPRKHFKVSYRLAKNYDKKLLFAFEKECVKTEPEILKPEYEYIKKKLRTIRTMNFNRAKEFKVIIALVADKVVGELSMSWYFNPEINSKVGIIIGLWVLKPYRMAGIGSGLINFAKKEFRKMGIKRIELVVGLFNRAALAFYQKLGFEIKRIGRASLNF